MAFTVVAVMLGGFTLYNLGATGATTAFTLDPQQRLAAVVGNKHANINYAQVLTQWEPLMRPNPDNSTNTMYRKFKAKTDSVSTDPLRRQRGLNNIKKYNYRQGSSFMVRTDRIADNAVYF